MNESRGVPALEIETVVKFKYVLAAHGSVGDSLLDFLAEHKHDTIGQAIDAYLNQESEDEFVVTSTVVKIKDDEDREISLERLHEMIEQYDRDRPEFG